jgi:hypothetical protein
MCNRTTPKQCGRLSIPAASLERFSSRLFARNWTPRLSPSRCGSNNSKPGVEKGERQARATQHQVD